MEISALNPAATVNAQTSSAFSQLTSNFDTFLTLLTTQLRNQNPLEPLNTEKFTEQLVQFASVEQSIKTNTNLEALIALQTTSERDSAIGFVGKKISTDGPVAANSGVGASWTYQLPKGVNATLITITNERGEVVARRTGAVAAGEHAVNWNGLNDNGAQTAPGKYTLKVEAADAKGDPLAATIQSQSNVTGVLFSADGPMLETPAGLVAIDAVRRVLAGA